MFSESVVQQNDFSLDLAPVGKSEDLKVSSPLEGEPHDTIWIDTSDGGAEIVAEGLGHDVGDGVDPEEELEVEVCQFPGTSEEGTMLGPELSQGSHDVQEHVNKQPSGVHVHVSPKSRFISKERKGTDVELSFCNFALEESWSIPHVVWKQLSHVQEGVWGPWESQWKPNHLLNSFPPVG